MQQAVDRQFLNPNGIPSHSPGLERYAPTLACLRENHLQPQRGCVIIEGRIARTQPRWGWFDFFLANIPRVAPHSWCNPGLWDAIPLGLKRQILRPQRGCVPKPMVAHNGLP
jgi:hypothetical protein